MSSSDSLLEFEKYPCERLNLDGSNYSQWATGFKLWAGGLGLWPYISGEEQEPSSPATLSDPDQNILRQAKHAEQIKIFKQRRLLALSALSTAIDAQGFIYLQDVDDPHVGWTSLANKYLSQRRFFTIPKAHDSASISLTLQTLVVLKADLAALASSSKSATATPVSSGTTSAQASSPSSPSSSSPGEYKIPDSCHLRACPPSRLA